MAQNAQKLVSRKISPPLSGVGVTAFDRRHMAELVDGGVQVVSAQMSLFSFFFFELADGGVQVVSAQMSFSIVDTRPAGTFSQRKKIRTFNVLFTFQSSTPALQVHAEKPSI